MDEPEIRQRENGPEDDSFHAEEKPQKISLPTAGPPLWHPRLMYLSNSASFASKQLQGSLQQSTFCLETSDSPKPGPMCGSIVTWDCIWTKAVQPPKKSNFHFYWRILSNVKWVQMKKSHTWNGLSLLHSHLPVALKTQPSLIFHPSGQASSLSFHSFHPRSLPSPPCAHSWRSVLYTTLPSEVFCLRLWSLLPQEAAVPGICWCCSLLPLRRIFVCREDY